MLQLGRVGQKIIRDAQNLAAPKIAGKNLTS
jgi:hypothetical protein